MLDIALLVALASYRTEFRAHGDRSSLRQAIAFVPLYLAASSSSASFSLLTQRNDIDPEPLAGRNARHDLRAV